MRFEFDWDLAKAESGASMASRLSTPWASLAIPWRCHGWTKTGAGEERWVTIGRNLASNLLLVVHPY